MTPGTDDAGEGGTPGLLAEALRYVSAWRGRTVAVKVGGSVLDDGMPGGLPQDLALLHRAGIRTVVVHGGGAEVDRVLRSMGRSPAFVDGLRVTDDPTMEAVEMVLSGRVNKEVVRLLEQTGIGAAGVSGADGGLLRVRPHPDADRIGRVGRVERVDASLLETLLDAGFLPVVSPVGADRDGRCHNVNADAAAAAAAAALGAEKLVLATDVEGILRAVDGETELVSELDPGEARELVREGVVSSGMVPKVRACLSALEDGVRSAHVVGVESPHAVLRELLTERGVGTMIRSGRQGADAPGEGAAAGAGTDAPASRVDRLAEARP